ncbi:sialidase family protein [Amycolatopsis alkalitolerans]|uniref:Exo-alpha-sialidase n=1 Tax=Amycolatopsis alkalitolerans TaxID=2547244 RepID=A0A5C4LWN8_9PSEU|nr:sialidase family protein [Amycolatopsis alkalitolerans]TNC22222.1 exo-alpha-sialidase [Amycolatopsis alkalitolerans]
MAAAFTVVLATPGAAGVTTGSGAFSTGQLQVQTAGQTGCGTNQAGEPSIHVSRAGLVGISSETGLGGGSQYWRGSSAATACGLTYAGQPNAIGGIGLSGGDTDTAFAPVKSSSGTYRMYVASLNLGSVNVAVSNDNGVTFSQMPVQAGLPLDDREWIAAYGADTSLLSYHDVATDNIDILRSDNGGQLYTQLARVIPDTDYKATNNELGNLVIDHRNASPVAGGFWAYQSFVAPSTATGSAYDEAFAGVSDDGGSTWAIKPIGCSTSFGKNGLGHVFPNVSVAPDGTLYYAMSNGSAIYVARSGDHGDTWTCSGPVSTTKQAIEPWLVATSAGVDLVYYGTPDARTWYVYFAQHTSGDLTSWSTRQVTAVHQGSVCEGGISCTGGRQLFDDFGVDTDPAGYAHIAYTMDSPALGGSNSATGYAVQTGGTPVGYPN